MQDRVSSLVENNTKLGKVQRKQIQGIQGKVEQLEKGYSIITEEQSQKLTAKIEQYMESEAVKNMIERNLN